jgi:hypothetical protein
MLEAPVSNSGVARETCLESLRGSSLTEWLVRGGTLDPPRSGAMSTSPLVSFSRLAPEALPRNRAGSWSWLGILSPKLVREPFPHLPVLGPGQQAQASARSGGVGSTVGRP